jgi:hypothetical protein
MDVSVALIRGEFRMKIAFIMTALMDHPLRQHTRLLPGQDEGCLSALASAMALNTIDSIDPI